MKDAGIWTHGLFDSGIIEYERYFRNQLAPWVADDLKLECKDCHKESEDVSSHQVIEDKDQFGDDNREEYDLCPKCYGKRTGQAEENEGDDGQCTSPKPATEANIQQMLTSGLLLLRPLEGLPSADRVVKLREFLAEPFNVAPGMERAADAYKALCRRHRSALNVIYAVRIIAVMIPYSVRWVYTPPPGAQTLRHHSIPPSPSVADVPGSGSPFTGGTTDPGGTIGGGYVADQNFSYTDSSGNVLSTFTFMFWSVNFIGAQGSNRVVPNTSLGSVQVPQGPPAPSAVQLWAWYCQTGGGGTGRQLPPQVWIDAFDISQNYFSNDPDIVNVVTPPSTTADPTLTAEANSQGVVPTTSSSEDIQAYQHLVDDAVFDHWGKIFGPSPPTPSVSVDTSNQMQLDASQGAGSPSPAYWIAFYKPPPPTPPPQVNCAMLKEQMQTEIALLQSAERAQSAYMPGSPEFNSWNGIIEATEEEIIRLETEYTLNNCQRITGPISGGGTIPHGGYPYPPVGSGSGINWSDIQQIVAGGGWLIGGVGVDGGGIVLTPGGVIIHIPPGGPGEPGISLLNNVSEVAVGLAELDLAPTIMNLDARKESERLAKDQIKEAIEKMRKLIEKGEDITRKK